MDIKALRYFLKISETGSFLETARQLNVPISSVSRFVSALEKDLGQQLLYRSTRAIRLTEEGRLFQLKVRDALDMLDEARQELSPDFREVRGSVSINAPLALGRIHIAPLVNQLLGRYPDLKVELTVTDSFVDPVHEGSDLIVRVGKLVDSNLIGKFTAPQRFVLAASPRYLQQFGIPRKPADLQAHNCLPYKGRYGIQRWYLGRPGNQETEEVVKSGSFLSNSAESLVSAAIDGHGLVLFPTWLFDPQTF
jgi:DNA-binding transcriptional LysR family regulator